MHLLGPEAHTDNLDDFYGDPVQWLPRYRDYLYGQGLSPKTVRVYVQKLEAAAGWCDAQGVRLTTLTASEARDLAGTFPNSASSRRQLRTACKHYWDMLGLNGPVKAFRVPPKPQPVWRGLEPYDAGKLVKAAKGIHPRGS